MATTRSGRTIKKPARFAEMSFVPGSGMCGCDHYDRGFDRGRFAGTYRDQYEKAVDIQYTKDLEKAMANDEITQKLPLEISGIVSNFANGRSHYRDDISFIASDNIKPMKQIDNIEEESEWETGDETSDEEWDEEME